MKFNKLKLIRLTIIGFYLACLLFFIYVMVKNPLENDIYHIFGHVVEMKNFHCPSCGATRAVYCLATFQFGKAFYYHAFLTVTAPILAYIFLTLTVNLFAGKKIIPYPKNYAVYLYVYLGLYLAFAVFRNLVDFIY